MEPAYIGLIGIILLTAILSLRFPVAPAVFIVSVTGIAVTGTGDTAGIVYLPATIAGLLKDSLPVEAIATLVSFVLLGNLAFYAGISTRIYDAARVWLQAVPGGLALATVLGCGGFAALSGSSVNCATTMGRICLPEMLRLGYDPRLASASVAVGGTLGSLIPPSILFIFYGILVDQPIGPLFIAGLLPGLLSLVGMMAVILWWIRTEPVAGLSPPGITATKTQAALALWPSAAMTMIIVGGLFLGLLGPLGTALISVALILIVGVLNQGLSGGLLWIIIRDSVLQAASLIAALVAAVLLMAFFDQTGAASIMVQQLSISGVPALSVIAAVAVILLIMGMFIEPMAILVLTMPVIYPLVQSYGLNPIWMAVVIVKLLEIALITPPIGLNVFVICSVSRDVTSEQAFRGVSRFLLVDVLVLAVLILFPAVSVFLPGLMLG